MTPFDRHFKDLQAFLAPHNMAPGAVTLPSGANLIEIPNFPLSSGWSQRKVILLFLAPAAYPSAAPDSFWVDPAGLRLADGRTPQNTNDANPIPEVGLRGTWFSWHVQNWRPNASSLITFFNVIRNRLEPPR